ncbi:hypothetical protein CLV90_2028 [Maribacter spongiicola]|uniref:GLPGLI family protein n=1 Tax=Maribacter spongiicola TaxID=1206753 RepID=A0A4R7K5J4_9FLAO|nr:hypothetical protein [Maribacter spongiicola]TDT44949.1 hypothetical protein CLV90_2028 [Maribacter spongiicola]
MKTNQLIFLLVLALMTSINVISQDLQKEPKFYNWFDNNVNRYNTSLYNGIEYIELFRTINERHKFFESSEFQPGSIVYDNQFYNQVPLKYDLNTDDILFNVGYNYDYPTLILHKSKIESFQINKSNFIQINTIGDNVEMNGFYQVLLKKLPLKLLKKTKKKNFKRIKGNTVYYEFDYDNSYYVEYHEKFYPIGSKNDVIRMLPEKKEYINEYFNSALKKSNEDNFWISFFEKLADTFNTQNKE